MRAGKLVVLLSLFSILALSIPLVLGDEYLITSYTSGLSAQGLRDLHPSDSGEYSTLGECFQSEVDYYISTVSFEVKKVGSPLGNAHAVLYEMTGTLGTNGKPTGTALATSNSLAVSSLTTSYVWRNFTFPSTYHLEMGHNYSITFQNPLNGSGTIDSSNYIVLQLSASDDYPGNAFYYENGAWDTTGVSTWDLNFQVYGDAEVDTFEYHHASDIGTYWFTNSYNITPAALTPYTWTTIDVSSYIPSNFSASGVILDVHGTTNSQQWRFAVRHPDSTDQFLVEVEADFGAGQYAQTGLVVSAINASGCFELYGSGFVAETWPLGDIYLMGFTDETVHYFVDAEDKTTTTTNEYVTVNVTDIVSANADSVFVVMENNNGTAPALANATVRPSGSSIDTSTCAIDFVYSRYAFVGLNASKCFEQYITDLNQDLYIIAYMEDTTFYSYAEPIEIELPVETALEWTTVDLTNNGTGVFAMFFWNNLATAGPELEIRHGDSTDDRAGEDHATIYEDDYHRAQIWHGCGLNLSDDLQYWFGNTNVELWLFGGTKRSSANYAVTLSEYPSSISKITVNGETWTDYHLPDYSKQLQINNLYRSGTITVYYIKGPAYKYNFYGVYDEDTGTLKDPSERAVNVTAYYAGATTETFEVNGTYTHTPVSQPLYFHFNLTHPRQYWISPEEEWEDIYIFDTDTTVYTIEFLDLAGALDDYPFVTASRYVNGSLRIVEKRKVDVKNTISMSLKNGEKYTIIIRDGTTYTFGDLLFTSTTSVTLTLRGLDFPQNVILAYRYVRLYAERHNNYSSISLLYEDTKQNTAHVDLTIKFANGTAAYQTTQYSNSFNVTWTNANYNITYYVEMDSHHNDYGELNYRATLYRGGFGQTPWGIDWLGNIPGMQTSSLLPIFLILCAAGVFSKVNAYVGAFMATILAAIFTWWGWIDIAPGLVIMALAFTILMALAYKKRRVVGY